MRTITLVVFTLLTNLLMVSAQAPTTPLGPTFPKPPESAAFEKFGDNSISGYTGVPGISIPIATLTEGPLSLSVGLQYNASGLRVVDVAPSVGAGWSLNAGGMISRQIRGKAADERDNGLWQTRAIYGQPDCSAPGPFWTDLLGPRDTEPDMFSFNFGGYSGKFYFADGLEVVQIPQSDLKIDYEVNYASPADVFRLRQFTITTPNGDRYIFGTVNPTDTLNNNAIATYKSAGTLSIDAPVANTWYLVKIETADRKHAINLEYEDNRYMHLYWNTYNDLEESGVPLSPALRSILEMYIADKFVSKIYTSTEEILFENTTPREDLHGSDRLKVDKITYRSTGLPSDYCKIFDFTYDYLIDHNPDVTSSTIIYDPDYKRLQLLALQEKSCDETIVIPAYEFEYYEHSPVYPKYFPSRLNDDFDHWGYYNNNHTSNLAICQMNDGIQDCAGAPLIDNCPTGLDTDEAAMRIGTLNKITYPTGGHTEFELEANEVNIDVVRLDEKVVDFSNGYYPFPPTGGSIGSIGGNIDCDVDFSNYPTYQLSYKVKYAGGTLGSSGLPPAVLVEVFEDIPGQSGCGGTKVHEFIPNPNFTYGSDFEEEGLLVDVIPNFSIDKQYNFTFSTTNAGLDFEISAINGLAGFLNVPVGGLRTKSIKDFSDATTMVKEKSYEYIKEFSNATSSGRLFQKPVYWYAFCGDTTIINTYTANKQSLAPLTSFEGNHIAYDRIVERFSDNTSIESKYYIEDKVAHEVDQNCYWRYDRVENGDTLPAMFLHPHLYEYPYPTVLDGTLKEKRFRDYTEATQRKETYVYNWGLTDYYTIDSETFVRQIQTPDAITYYYMDQMRTKVPLLLNKEIYADGVTTSTDYVYGQTDFHFFPTEEITTDSEDKEYKTVYSYIVDYPIHSLKRQLTERHLIAEPFKTLNYVDGVLVDGYLAHFRFFNSTTGAFQDLLRAGAEPRIWKAWNYEKTWDENDNLIGTGWLLDVTIDSYDANGFIKQLTSLGWESEHYEWTANGQLTKRTFEDFVWEYDYYPGTRFLESITDVDGQVSTFYYDQLMRLWKTEGRANNVIREYSFHYHGPINAHNWINAKTTFTPVGGSSLTTLETNSYVDGLGRPELQVQVKYSPDQKDVVVKTTYDNLGRAHKVFIPYESAFDDGRYIDIPGDWKFTETLYDGPLNRVSSQTPADWYATTTEYDRNLISEVINPVTNIAYPLGTLMKTVVTDPNGNKMISFVDKLGRKVLDRRANASDSQTADTYYLYDAKSRLTTILPPDASLTDSELIYEYLYDQTDNIIRKKIPGQVPINYLYNIRNLLTYTQDGNMAAEGKWLLNKYDVYGRSLESGFYIGTPASGNHTYNFSELLTKNVYGTSGIELGKIKENENRILHSTDFIKTTFSYDDYGRISSEKSNNHLNLTNPNAEVFAYNYDFADNITWAYQTHRPSSASQTLMVNRSNYDHSGRLSLDAQTIGSNGEVILADYQYNYRDFMTAKNLHQTSPGNFLQTVDYSYNVQGWLTQINDFCDAANPSTDLFAMKLDYDVSNAVLQSDAQKNGNIASMSWQVGCNNEQAYGFRYDFLDRMDKAVYAEFDHGAGNYTNFGRYNVSTSYDKRGNILTMRRNGHWYDDVYNLIDLMNYTYSGNQLTQVSEFNYIYPRDNGFKTTTTDGIGAYTYDSNGNLLSDQHKDISNIEYNYLNLPRQITWANGDWIEWTYDAAGNMLKKETSSGIIKYYINDFEYDGTTLEAIYNKEGRAVPCNGGYCYEYALKDHLDNTRVNFADLNNDGAVDETEILQENHYYPFGMRMEGNWAPLIGSDNKYQYNGKELSDDFGLNWLDFGFRFYDPAIARFPSVDPIAEEFAFVTPFNYAENSPIANIDLWGLQSLSFNLKDEIKGVVNYFLPNVTVQESTKKSPPRRRVTGKEIGEGTKGIGDKISKGAVGVGVIFPPVGAKMAIVGETIEIGGHTIVLMSELSNDGLTQETTTDISLDLLFGVLPKPLENALENAGIDKQAKGIIEGQINLVNEVAKEGTKKKVAEAQQSSKQNQSNTEENCEESCENN
ncbi:MAG: RHS repeat-associated core domain-containing protein [Bacteroidota bacterium]